MSLSTADELKLQTWAPVEIVKEESYKRYLPICLKNIKKEENKTSSYSADQELKAIYSFGSSNLNEDDYKILPRFYLRPTRYKVIDYKEELIQQTNQKYAIDLSYKIGELKNTIGDQFLNNPKPDQINYLINSVEETLNLLTINSCHIIDLKGIIRFLEQNIEIANLLKEAIIEIPKYINNKYSFRLKLKEDPEINNLSTLFLFIVCKIKPNAAFKLLKKIDEYWYLKKVTDVNKFNINIEFI